VSAVIKLENISKNYGVKSILDNINFEFEKGFVYGIIGPNGSGKTTLIDLLTSNLKPDNGVVLVDEIPIDEYTLLKRARKLAYLPQNATTQFGFTVEELLHMGTYSGRKLKEKCDDSKKENYIKQTEIQDFRHKKVTELSGGELQRVMFAKTLCQESEALILDEGTSNADIYFKVNYFKLLREQAIRNKLVIAVVHDLSFARKYCDKLVILKDQKIYRAGKSREVLDEIALKEVFNIEGEFYKDALLLI
jgi:iron complex transport system ATP-binding protein